MRHEFANISENKVLANISESTVIQLIMMDISDSEILYVLYNLGFKLHRQLDRQERHYTE